MPALGWTPPPTPQTSPSICLQTKSGTGGCERVPQGKHGDYGLESEAIEFVYKFATAHQELANHPYSFSGGGAATVIKLTSTMTTFLQRKFPLVRIYCLVLIPSTP